MEQVLNNDVPQNISSQSDCMCVLVRIELAAL